MAVDAVDLGLLLEVGEMVRESDSEQLKSEKRPGRLRMSGDDH